MSDDSEQEYTVIDESVGSRRSRRGKARKNMQEHGSDSEPEPSYPSRSHRGYEEDDDYSTGKSSRSKSKSLRSSDTGGASNTPSSSKSSKKNKKSKKKEQTSDEEMEVDDLPPPIREEVKSVPPLKIKIPQPIPPPPPKRTSGRISKPRIDENTVVLDDDVLNESCALPSSSRSKSKSGGKNSEEDSGPTRRSERIFVSHTKKVEPKDEDEDEEEEEFEIIHKDFCNSCRAGGDLILCDYCPRAYHKVCLDDEIDEIPDDWDCPHCVKNGRPDLKELKEAQQKKLKRKQAAAMAAAAASGSSGGSASRSSKRGEKVENNDFCQVCNQLGELVLCDTCPRAYHLVCMDQNTEIPSGQWSCPHCKEHGVEFQDVVEEKPEKVEKIFCKTCRQQGGDIVFCSNCPNKYHLHCVNPPLEEAPEDWRCIVCSVEKLKAKVQKILTWRWKKRDGDKDKDKEKTSAEDDTKNLLKNLSNRRPREREFFIKWKDMSYWHCTWVSEDQLQVFHSGMLRSFSSKFDMNNPPMFDETGASVNLDEHEPHSSDPNIDKHLEYHRKQLKHRRRKRCTNLPEDVEENFVRYGIKPEWLLIHRIVNHRKMSKQQGGGLYYVIKWRDLQYEEVTAEAEPDLIDFPLPDYQAKVDEYWAHKKLIEKEHEELRRKEKSARSSKGKNDKNKKDKDKDKIADPKKKYEIQPDYIPEPFKLHPYQMEGLNWLRYSWATETDTILADEMGLGKTVQTVAFLYSLYKEGHCKGPFLIAAPLSTIINWERELEDWCPDFYVVNYTGNKDSRILIRENELSFDQDCVRSTHKAMKIRKNIPVKFHVLLTSYELINGDSALLGSIDWKVLVVDEAHRLKSNQSLFFRTLRDYSVDHRLLLTGTPLQNNLEELFNLLNFLSPNTFKDQDGFLNEFADIAKEDQVKKLHQLLGPHLLRRMKADVLEGMPTKSEFIVRVDLAPLQKKYYKWILTKNFQMLNQKGSGKQMSLLNVVMDLKKCCNHPYLFPGAEEEAPKDRRGFYEGTALVKACGKLIVLQKMLKKLKAEGHRVLIFSQMTQMLDVLEDFLEAEAYKYERIDGGITGIVRQEAIDRFNAPGAQQFVFLLSTRAGGLGINLATADTVVIYDSDWNPHNDIQALSRAHRLGQTNKVMIYRFVTRNSVEERITQVAKKKMMLTHLVVRPGLGGGSQKQGASMSKQELDDILKFGTEELFKEEEGKEQEMIVYDDRAIDELLDRTQEGIEQKELLADEYMSSFKVASYVTKEADDGEDEAEEIEKKDTAKKIQEMDDPMYWEKLLGAHYFTYQDGQHKTLGKGKRVRKQVNYIDPSGGGEYQVPDSSGESSDYSVPSEASEDDGDFDDRADTRGQKQQRKNQKEKEKMPSLLNTVTSMTGTGTYLEVLGFTPSQRKLFHSLVLRFGLPPIDIPFSDTQFYVRELKSKPEKHLRAYTQMYVNHLYEPGTSDELAYEDGVPKESLNPNQVLTRIGIISLIRRKVSEYQNEHGLVSYLPPRLPSVQIGGEQSQGISLLMAPKTETTDTKDDKDEAKEVKDEIKETKEEAKDVREETNKYGDVDMEEEKKDETAADKMEVDEFDGSCVSKPEGEVKESEEEKKDEAKDKHEAQEDTDKSMDAQESEKSPEKPVEERAYEEKADEGKADEGKADEGKADEEKADEEKEVDKEVSIQENQETKKEAEEEVKEVKPFNFNIQDGGMTELHTLWFYEEKALKPRKEHEIWNKRHDYWLLNGMVKHGYESWDQILSDYQYAILKEPFKTAEPLTKQFFERRLKLIEQSLIFEEQLRRYSHLVNVDKMIPVSSLPKEETDEKEENVEKEKMDVNVNGDENGEKKEDKDDDKTEEKNVLNGDLKNGDHGEKNGNIDEEPENEGGDKENESMVLNPAIQKAANQIESLFLEMKSDCARIPQTVQRIPSIAARLQIQSNNQRQSFMPQMQPPKFGH